MRPGQQMPHIWRSGPDPQRHQQYQTWQVHRCQARYRGEQYDLTFEDYHEIWGVHWCQRGRRLGDLQLRRRNPELPWRRDNTQLMRRLTISRYEPVEVAP